MPPIGFDHGMGVANLTQLLVRLVGDRALVWPQGPIQISPGSRPEPDIALLKPQRYSAKKPVTPSDVLLVVEVADTTLKYDREEKGPLYAEAGIPEYWIVNLPERVIEVYIEPSGGSYKQTRKLHRGEMLTLPAELGGSVEVNDILGKTGET
jgi:Uma2 family endonuclease